MGCPSPPVYFLPARTFNRGAPAGPCYYLQSRSPGPGNEVINGLRPFSVQFLLFSAPEKKETLPRIIMYILALLSVFFKGFLGIMIKIDTMLKKAMRILCTFFASKEGKKANRPRPYFLRFSAFLFSDGIQLLEESYPSPALTESRKTLDKSLKNEYS